MIKQNEIIIDNLINHLKLGKPIQNKKRKSIDKKTQTKYKIWLNKLSIWFNKPFDKLNQEDIDKFRNDLKDDIIRQNNGEVYSSNTKRDIEQKFLRVLLNYLGKYELSLYHTDYKDEGEVPALSKEEIEKMIIISKLRDKVIIQLLYDGGLRVDEFRNIQFKDVKDESLKNLGYYKIRVTTSKTKPRTIGLTLPQSTEILKEWLNFNKDKIGTSKPLVDISYRHLNLNLKRLGDTSIKKRVTPHMLRHSSATHYCHSLSQYQMCKRFGWSMSSDMPKRYIDAEGVEDDKINEFIAKEENTTLQKQINSLQEKLNLKNQEITEGKKEFEERMKKQEEQMQEMRKQQEKIMKSFLKDIKDKIQK